MLGCWFHLPGTQWGIFPQNFCPFHFPFNVWFWTVLQWQLDVNVSMWARGRYEGKAISQLCAVLFFSKESFRGMEGGSFWRCRRAPSRWRSWTLKRRNQNLGTRETFKLHQRGYGSWSYISFTVVGRYSYACDCFAFGWTRVSHPLTFTWSSVGNICSCDPMSCVDVCYWACMETCLGQGIYVAVVP